VGRLAVSRYDAQPVTARLTDGRVGREGRAVRGTFAWRERGVFVQPAAGAVWFASDPQKPPTDPAREIPVQGITLPTDRDGWRVHFGPLDAPHRVACVKEVSHAGR
jgi:hypothetical protein